MGFAILYEPSDLQVIGDAIAGSGDLVDLTPADRQEARRYWNGGIKNYATAGPYTGDSWCPLCRVLPCTYGTVAEFAALLHRAADALGGNWLYLHALANDIVGESGHLEPYP